MQTAIGSDIMMVLDECIDSTADEATTRAAMERTHRWALRSLAARDRTRAGAVRHRAGRRGPGAAARVGGVPHRASVRRLRHRRPRRRRHARAARGDDRARRRAPARRSPALPDGRRHAARSPARHRLRRRHVRLRASRRTLAWQGTAFTSTGRVRVTRGAESRSPTSRSTRACACSTCRRFSRAYLHHLMKCSEPLGPRLLVDPQPAPLPRSSCARRARRSTPASTRRSRASGWREIDRHEHAEARAWREREPRGACARAAARCAMRSLAAGEVMHPGVGPLVEAEQLYVAPVAARASGCARRRGDARRSSTSGSAPARTRSRRAPRPSARRRRAARLRARQLRARPRRARRWRSTHARRLRPRRRAGRAARALLARRRARDRAHALAAACAASSSTRSRASRRAPTSSSGIRSRRAPTRRCGRSPRSRALRRVAGAALHALHLQRLDRDARRAAARRLGGRRRRRHRRQGGDHRRRRARRRSRAAARPRWLAAPVARRRAAARDAPADAVAARRRRAAVLPMTPAQSDECWWLLSESN